MSSIQNLRQLKVVLSTDGTALPLQGYDVPVLYQGSYGFILLQAYVPVTQNAVGEPLCTVYRSVIDNTGVRRQYRTENFNMLYVQKVEIEGKEYMLFECPLPQPFTSVVGEFEMVFNYTESTDVEIPDPQEPNNTIIVKRALYRMTTNIYSTTVLAGGVAESDIELALYSQEAEQINANKIAIETLMQISNGVLGDLDDLYQKDAKDVQDLAEHKVSADAHADIRQEIANIALGSDGTSVGVVREMIDTSIDANNFTLRGQIQDAYESAIVHHDQSNTSHIDMRDNIAGIDNQVNNPVTGIVTQLNNINHTIPDLHSDIINIKEVIPSSANIQNKLVDLMTMRQAIVTNTTRFLTFDSNGNPFPTFADLSSATEFYYEGNSVLPTNNDFCIVLADENYDNGTVQYMYDGSNWIFMYKVSDVAFTEAQWQAINSGITAFLANSIPNKVDMQTFSNTLQAYLQTGTAQTMFASKGQVDYIYDDYVKHAELDAKQDKLIAGSGITIASDGKTISSSASGLWLKRVSIGSNADQTKPYIERIVVSYYINNSTSVTSLASLLSDLTTLGATNNSTPLACSSSFYSNDYNAKSAVGIYASGGSLGVLWTTYSGGYGSGVVTFSSFTSSVIKIM